MDEFFCLDSIFSEQLLAKVIASDMLDERVQCPIDPAHQLWSPRAQASRVNPEIHVEVRHSRRDQSMIWTWTGRHCLLHNNVLAQMATRGFTGYESRRAWVRFRDGRLSDEYHRIAVRGWGGTARPESGVRIAEGCIGCLRKRYTPLLDPTQLINRSSWTGEDFFIVWPLANYIFVTRRVVEFLRETSVKSCEIRSLTAESRERPFTGTDGFIVTGLANVLPEELAIRYGRHLGIA